MDPIGVTNDPLLGPRRIDALIAWMEEGGVNVGAERRAVGGPRGGVGTFGGDPNFPFKPSYDANRGRWEPLEKEVEVKGKSSDSSVKTKRRLKRTIVCEQSA